MTEEISALVARLSEADRQRYHSICEALRVEWRLKAQGVHHDHLSDLAWLIAQLDAALATLTAQAQALTKAEHDAERYAMEAVGLTEKLIRAERHIAEKSQALTALREERGRLLKQVEDAASGWRDAAHSQRLRAEQAEQALTAKDAALEVIFMAIDRATLSDLADGGDLGPRAERAVRAIADLDAERLRRAKSEAAKDAEIEKLKAALKSLQSDHAEGCGWWHAEGDTDCTCGRGQDDEIIRAALTSQREAK